MAEYSTLSSLQLLSEADAEFTKALDRSSLPARYPDLHVGRKKMLEHDVEAAVAMQNDAVLRTSKHISMRDGFKSELQIFSPRHVDQAGTPLIILYFGGGFMFGNNLQCANYAVTLSRLYSSVVVLPSYRLAPECPFPVAPNDAWDNFVWIATHAETLGADPSCGFVVGGRSAGGTLAAIIAQKANIEDFKPRISGTWLSVPMLLSEQCVPEIDRSLWISREQNKDSPVFNTEMLGVLMSAWKPDELSPHFSPFNVEAGAQRGLPTTYIQVCGMDPLRDDGLLYEKLLRHNGVKTIIDVYSGVPHGVTVPYPHLAASRKYQVDVIARIGELLGKHVERDLIEQTFPWPRR